METPDRSPRSRVWGDVRPHGEFCVALSYSVSCRQQSPTTRISSAQMRGGNIVQQGAKTIAVLEKLRRHIKKIPPCPMRPIPSGDIPQRGFPSSSQPTAQHVQRGTVTNRITTQYTICPDIYLLTVSRNPICVGADQGGSFGAESSKGRDALRERTVQASESLAFKIFLPES